MKLQKYAIKALDNGNVEDVLGFVHNSNWYKVTDDHIAMPVLLAISTDWPSTQSIADQYFYALVGYDPLSGTLTNTPIIDNTTTGTQPLAGFSCANSLLGTSLTSNIIN